MVCNMYFNYFTYYYEIISTFSAYREGAVIYQPGPYDDEFWWRSVCKNCSFSMIELPDENGNPSFSIHKTCTRCGCREWYMSKCPPHGVENDDKPPDLNALRSKFKKYHLYDWQILLFNQDNCFMFVNNDQRLSRLSAVAATSD